MADRRDDLLYAGILLGIWACLLGLFLTSHEVEARSLAAERAPTAVVDTGTIETPDR